MDRPERLIKKDGELIEALWQVYLAVEQEHSGQHFEPECPECLAVLEVWQLLSEGAGAMATDPDRRVTDSDRRGQ